MNIEDGFICFTCQDFEKNVGHSTKWCPKNVCQKCGQNGHIKLVCMFGLENFPLPNEIFLQILGYLSGKDLEQSAKVSKRLSWITWRPFCMFMPWVWILWSKKKNCSYFSKRKWKYFYTFNHFYSEKSSKRAK